MIAREDAPLRLEALPSLRSLVAARLREAIVVGRFPPGSRLVERNLCELMGVSRTSVREALRELESEGLVSNIPNRGPIVSILTVKEARDIFAVRADLEGLASALFAERADELHLAALGEIASQLDKIAPDYNQARFLELKREFYQVLLAGADNETLANLVQTILTRVARLRVISLAQPSRPRQSADEIQCLLDALRRRDATAARAASLAHVRNALAAALEGLESDRPPVAAA